MDGTILKCAEQNILKAGFCVSQWEFGNDERRISSQEKNNLCNKNHGSDYLWT